MSEAARIRRPGSPRHTDSILRHASDHDEPNPLLRLQRSVGNSAVARLMMTARSNSSTNPLLAFRVQRVSIGTSPNPKPTKQWEVMGGFAGKHLVEGAISVATAKDKWKERYAKDKKGVPNTVASQEDLSTSITDGKVTGTYPAPRGPRGTMTVEVKGYTVFPSTAADGKKVPGRAKQLSKIAVVGTSSESLYFPDHLYGKNSS